MVPFVTAGSAVWVDWMDTSSPQAGSIGAAELDWNDAGEPRSRRFNDRYFSAQDGLAESRHVFLEHNALQQRWRNLPADQHGVFTITETGFGTGLNFVASWQLWQRCAPPHWSLIYRSIERYPLSREDILRALARWPELDAEAQRLAAAYPPTIEGLHCLSFDKAVQLQLYFMDIDEALDEMQACPAALGETVNQDGLCSDAWYLDGFTPARNPAMWSDSLFRSMRRLSTGGSSFATFSAAGQVRRGLQANGFEVHKTRGYGSKRDMLYGKLQLQQAPGIATAPADSIPQTPRNEGRPADQPIDARERTLWYLNPPGFAALEERRAIVIGAGLAGCHSACSLARRGWQVDLIERHPRVAAEASGNPLGVLYTRLSLRPGALNRFNLSTYLHALGFYRPLLQQELIKGELCGVLQLGFDQQETDAQQALAASFADQPELCRLLNRDQAADVSGVPLSSGGLFFPQAGWIDPASLCRYLASQPGITLMPEQQALTLRSTQGRWQVLDSAGQVISSAAVVIIANASDSLSLLPEQQLPLKRIRGQISLFNSPPEQAHALRTVLCHDGYIGSPTVGRYCIGATFDLHSTDPAVTPADHQDNLDRLARHCPDLHALLGSPGLEELDGGRTAFRCIAPDYLPLLGPLPDRAAFIDTYQALAKNARLSISTPGPYQRGLYLNLGHGSRGLTSTPLAGEYLAALINGEPPPLPRSLQLHVNPARFLIRDIRRNRLPKARGQDMPG